MGAAATPKGQGFSRRRFRHGGSRPSPLHRSRSRQPFRHRRGCSLSWNFCSHLQTHQRKNLCRLYCSFVMEYDIHTLLDLATLVTTLWVIYMIRFKLKSSYMEDKDNFAIYYVMIPCAVLALFIHPSTSHHLLNRIAWAFCVYLEAVSVLPQLRVMQNTKIVEPFTAHYVFALGVARFLSCAHWVLQVLDSRGHLLVALGYGLWPSMVLISEIVQTFILADFCYYYVKSVFGGQFVLRLPSGVV
ncbi:ER lumen protein-retaining receptor erd-2.2 isoform X2 [Glycine max]|uniref:ER lumen protein-retaining receptor erd-2.2 isoform X2 n=1 Tax=Glycine max TaxID=3847 RepID=UPI001B355107|nr:ER lumen protein-retaining receptor erd-2.2 isoform X2 [Glycine max]